MRRDVLLPFHNIVARTERCAQQTLLFGPYFLRTKLFVGQRGGGGGAGHTQSTVPYTPLFQPTVFCALCALGSLRAWFRAVQFYNDPTNDCGSRPDMQ